MDIFDKELPKKYEYCSVDYLFNKNTHSESLIMSFSDDDGKEQEQHYILKDASPGDALMTILDYNTKDEDSTLRAYDQLKKLADILPVKQADSSEDLLKLYEAYKPSDVNRVVDETYSIIRSAVELSPMMITILPDVYNIFSGLYYCVRRKKYLKLFIPSISHNLNRIGEFIEFFPEVYTKAREFCENVFLVDDLFKYKVDPNDIYEQYELYCSHSSIDNYLNTPVMPSSKKMKMKDSDLEQFIGDSDWTSFYSFVCKPEVSYYGEEYEETSIFTIEDLIVDEIRNMLVCKYVFRRCDLCGGYFKTRFFTVQECCTRPYKKFNVPCNEYVS
jgi:hypothetical protein